MEKDFYFEFENKFRGSRDEIKNRLSNYQGLLDYILLEFDSPQLLDIGCGRGEWLEKWNKEGFECIGIEKNQGMVDFCKDFGLDVLNFDAIDILRELPDKSVSLITLFHVIEHINSDELFILINEALSQDSELFSGKLNLNAELSFDFKELCLSFA